MIPQGVADGRKTVNIAQACKLVNVTRRTLYNWMLAKKIEWVVTAGGQRRIFVDTLWKEVEK